MQRQLYLKRYIESEMLLPLATSASTLVNTYGFEIKDEKDPNITILLGIIKW